MRFVNANGRAGLLIDEQVFDLNEISGGTVPADPTAVVRGHWDSARAVHAEGSFSGGRPLADVHLGPPVPEPRAVYAVGLNYKGHAEEAGRDSPPIPGIFTKFPTSLTGPFDDIVLPSPGMNDWEAELTFVVGEAGRHVAAADAYMLAVSTRPGSQT